MKTDDIREKVRAFILDEILPGERPENLLDDMPLRTSGLIDSMGTIRMTSYLESTFGISIAAHETGVENFETVDSICQFVAAKMAS
ncbi:MAG: acyl carrier protein [Phycisphaerales bacterium]|nr:acyl carrier protein [Phycisphaerales bacterium]